MKEFLSYLLLGFMVAAFFTIIALEDYAWSSWHGYVTVHAWEALVVVVLFVALSIFASIANAVDWCFYHIWHLMRKLKGHD